MSMRSSPVDLAASRHVVERELRERAAHFTGLCARALLVTDVLVAAALWPGAGNARGVLVCGTGTLAVVLCAVLLLVHFRRPRLGAWLMTGGLFVVLAMNYWSAGVIDSAPGAGIALVIVLAAVTLGRAALLFFGASACVLVVGMTFAFESQMVTKEPIRGPPIQVAIGLAFVCVTTTILMTVLLRAHARAIEIALTAARERDAAQIRSLEAEKLEPIGRLASGVAHDFNNLLGVIRGVSDLLRVRLGEPDVALRLLDDLENATTSATLMTKRLLSLARQRSPGPRSSDLAVVASELAPLVARLVGETIEVVVKNESTLTWVNVSQSELEQVLLNLAVNARDAMPHGGSIYLTIRDGAADRVELIVSDTGQGMPKDVLESAFSPFFTTKGTGTGLGLVTVRDVIERAAGTLTVTSEVGRGTTFVVSIPRAKPSVPPELLSGAFPSRLLRGRVLLVEDHDLVRRTHARLLEGLGFEVTTAVDGVDALERIDGGASFDLIVSDWLMPRLGGLELAEELERRRSGAPFLLVSGDAENAPTRLESLSFPTAFLMKPCKKAVLESQIASLLGMKAAPPVSS